jgi:hypothetical protein
LRKDTLLFISRVEPILVCPLCFTHCFLPFTNRGIPYHTCQYTNIHYAGKENEYSFIQKRAPVPKPQKRKRLISPCLKGRGFTPRLITA